MMMSRFALLAAALLHPAAAFYLHATASRAPLDRAPPASMADLSIESCGMKFPNPFVIGSGPPGTNYNTMAKAFKSGWGGVVAKTVSLTDNPVNNVAPRYGQHRFATQTTEGRGETVGFTNIELISDRPLEDLLDDFRRLKADFPDQILIASIMEQYDKERWQELTRKCAEAGVDGFECNFSCPHGHPERNMGAAMGQDPAMVEEVTGWVVEAASPLPVWAKMTPNIGDIRQPARAAFRGGAKGVVAINTILSCTGVDLETLRPIPTVEGHATYGGYSYAAVKPIALRMVSELARDEAVGEISGVGGVAKASDAIEHLLLGASTVQLCTGPMLQGHGMVKGLIEGLDAFMEAKGFTSVRDFVGHSNAFFTTHHNLHELQSAAKKAAKAGSDEQWGEDLTTTTDALTTN
jgi:dihydropyrimidine dehydrogenase (NADP+)